jgi:hypothetical protein
MGRTLVRQTDTHSALRRQQLETQRFRSECDRVRAVEACVVSLVHDGVRLLCLLGDGADGLLQNVALSSNHVRMLGGAADMGGEAPGAPICWGPLYASSELIASPEASSCRQH